jgi:hypothetical protein
MKMNFDVYGFEQVSGVSNAQNKYAIHQLQVVQKQSSDNSNQNRLVVAGGYKTENLRCTDAVIRKMDLYKGDWPVTVECEVSIQISNGNQRLTIEDVKVSQ